MGDLRGSRLAVYCILAGSFGCHLHLGVAPADSTYRLAAVYAPVAEPGVDEAVRAAVLDALAARRAHDAGGEPLTVTVERADFVPGRRGEGGLVYEARLVVRLEVGTRARVVSASRPVLDGGGSSGVAELRARVFGELAREVAADGIVWLGSP